MLNHSLFPVKGTKMGILKSPWRERDDEPEEKSQSEDFPNGWALHHYKNTWRPALKGLQLSFQLRVHYQTEQLLLSSLSRINILYLKLD